MNIYYLAPDSNIPCGGIRKIYRHVDILNRHGYAAFVLHEKTGFRCTWFENQTSVAYRINPLQPDDYLVVPEIYGPQIAGMEPGVKKVIFNQGVYLTFRGYSLDPEDLHSPYTDESGDIAGVMTISHDSAEYLRYVFPRQKTFLLEHYSRDLNLFSYSAEKKNQICFMPRKNYDDAQQVINILKFRGVLKQYKILEIEGYSIEETAKMMKESAIFLSFCYQEGSGLPASEAMLCGCIVIGYHGRGGREYFKPKFSYPIESGDVIGYAKAVEKVIKELEAKPHAYAKKTKAAAAFIRERYSPEKEEKELIQIWGRIIPNPSKLRGHNT